MKLRCVAVDDEPLALRVINNYVQKIPSLELVGTFESPLQAIQVLGGKDEVHLLFLDIQMPDLTGIQFIKSLPNPPYLIFTTAYSDYAMEGFNLNAIDYLLKPFSFERFLKAVNKVSELHRLSLLGTKDNQDDYLFVKAEHNIIKLNISDISYIEGFKDYIKIYTNQPKPILTIKSIKAMEELLEGKGFVRIHRSYIVSIKKIESFRNKRIQIKGKSLPIGESYSEQFYELVVKNRI